MLGLVSSRALPALSSRVASLQPQQKARAAALPRARPVVTRAESVTLPSVRASVPANVDFPGSLALVSYALHTVAANTSVSFALTPHLIYAALAWVTLVNGVLTLVPNSVEIPAGNVGEVIGPLFLAVNALNGLPQLALAPVQTATLLFGYLIAKGLPAFSYSTPVWLATLAAAVYKGLGAEWTVAAFGLSAAWRLAQGIQNKAVPYADLAFVAFAGYAAYQGGYELAALAIWAGHVLASILP